MSFPDVPRVIYQINPLDEVICQLRFPAILKIDAEPPVAFQELIRADYPFYEAKSPIRLPAGLPPNLAQMLVADLSLGGLRSHEFTSTDRTWTLRLSREFLALTCRSYERWENFHEQLRRLADALNTVYHPALFTRLGLRYRDVIRRSRLHLEETPWSELLQPGISGVLGIPDTAPSVQNAASNFVIHLPQEGAHVQVSAGLARDSQTNEIAFMIDADFFTDKQTECSDVFNHLNALNRQAGNFFRWCITDRLHEAMQPRAVTPL